MSSKVVTESHAIQILNPTENQTQLPKEKTSRGISPRWPRVCSLRPDHVLTEACIDREDMHHQQALAILESYRPVFTGVTLPKSHPAWLNDCYSPLRFVKQFRQSNGQQSEPSYEGTDQHRDELFVMREDAEKRESDLCAALGDRAEGTPLFRDNDETPEENLTGVAERAEAPHKMSAEKKRAREMRKFEKKAESAAKASLDHVFAKYEWLALARQHPNLDASERSTLTREIFRYGTYIAKKTDLLVMTGMVDDAANLFALKAIELMDAGRYTHRKKARHAEFDPGKFRGWLGKVWRNHVWSAITRKLIREKARYVGFQTWESEGEERWVEPGRVNESQIYSEAKDESEDRLSDRLFRDLALLRPSLSPEQTDTLDDLMSGETHESAARKRNISIKTVSRRFAQIRELTQRETESNPSQEPIDIQACADVPKCSAQEPWDAERIAEMIANAQWTEGAELSISACADTGDDGGDSLVHTLRRRVSAMTAEELAELLSLSSKHVYRMAKQGRVPHYRIGGAVRFDPLKLASWMETKAVA